MYSIRVKVYSYYSQFCRLHNIYFQIVVCTYVIGFRSFTLTHDHLHKVSHKIFNIKSCVLIIILNCRKYEVGHVIVSKIDKLILFRSRPDQWENKAKNRGPQKKKEKNASTLIMTSWRFSFIFLRFCMFFYITCRIRNALKVYFTNPPTLLIGLQNSYEIDLLKRLRNLLHPRRCKKMFLKNYEKLVLKWFITNNARRKKVHVIIHLQQITFRYDTPLWSYTDKRKKIWHYFDLGAYSFKSYVIYFRIFS